MTSVTVAGGSFDVARPAMRTLAPAKRDRWLRYGLGVSVAALLGADAIVLTGMLRDAEDAVRSTPNAAVAEAPAASAVEGDGFTAFTVPADLAAHYAARNPLPAAALLPSAAPTFSLPATAPSAPAGGTLPITPVSPSAAVPTGPTAQDVTPGPSVVEPLQPVIDQTTSVIEQLPVVGPEVAPVVEQVVETVVPVVEEVVEPVVTATEPAVAPVVGPVTTTAGGIL